MSAASTFGPKIRNRSLAFRTAPNRQASRQAVVSRDLEISARRQRWKIRLLSPDVSDVENLFVDLAKKWSQDTAFVSSVTDKAMHPAYQQIIGLGKDVLPLLLRELSKPERDHWFWALRAITGVDPVQPEFRGNIAAMAAAWQEWARGQNILF